MRCFFTFLVFCFSLCYADTSVRELQDDVFDLVKLGEKLEKDGLKGEMHGGVEAQGLYVFSYRDKALGFFKHIEFSLIARTPALKKQLASLKRHDSVKVKGKILKNKAAQPHIDLQSITILNEYKDADLAKFSKYKHKTDLATALKGKTEIDVVVHAVAREGKVLVVEYGDTVIPVIYKDNSLTDDVSRGDKIRIHFKLATHPSAPAHVVIDESASTPLEMLEHIEEGHEKSFSAEGELVFFPISPQITVPVFALRVEDKNGTARNYNLFSLDSDVFQEIQEACTKAWKKYESSAERGRNFLVNPKLRVKALGTLHTPANPQIILNKASDLKFTYNGKDL